MLRRSGHGAGLLGLAALLREAGMPLTAQAGATDPMIAHAPHFPGRARSVIWLFMNGGPSQVDTWDYKPELQRSHGKE